jgi:ATP-dependent Lon protease
MTGEINLRGQALAIGGLKEKLLAAQRSGIETVFIPKDNQKDLAEVPAGILKNLTVICVESIDEILPKVLTSPLKPLEASVIHKETPFAASQASESLPLAYR